MLIGEIGTFLAYGFAPAALVAPLGGLSVMFTCVLRSVIGDEYMRKQVRAARMWRTLFDGVIG